ncbi:16S rRNA (guanine(527)-N(7))-methyltransferase RsmG [Nocardioides sp. HDW12B]|uniref:16S rRNA (guanine(527)-N(7))-methyltransferase RsmG n=1 Tax=Nocardioides sp. HDW12B TaxID=2714939 RepID=UPI0014087438|nr:16S rRNA (guanine(527)-N(7))-methyltransferase RsmG [Nocardioides sp. HDW12B]QIK67922.1 16S rRNA (guanine(527)-N(7))-methyltransferase RsmG [Nocardioides sp. HDW12B]
MNDPVSRGTPPPPPSVAGVFHARTPLIEAYADWLAGPGIERGLIGPRELPRLWDRHVLNCAALAAVVAPDRRVADVGSGAGLPGLVLAIARPDLQVTLIEPLLRRTTFLEEVVADLGLGDQVAVARGRAEEVPGQGTFDVVTSRAVAALDKLLRWSLPLCTPAGEVLALKGRSAPDEIEAARPALHRLRCGTPEVLLVEKDWLSSPVTVVRVEARPASR